MDDRSFDGLARAFGSGMRRRVVLGSILTPALAAVVPAGGRAAAAASVAPAVCTGIGKRCGRGDQPPCGGCCTGFSTRQNNGQRRCACRPDLRTCRRDDECCSGLCCKIGGGRACIPAFFTCNGRCPSNVGPGGPTC